MKRSQDQSVDQLVNQFTEIALQQDKALLSGDTASYNRLYAEMEVVGKELKGRYGDQRRSLLRLYNHPNAQVRLKAAINTLAIERESAQRALQVISDRNEYPQAADARGMIRALLEGTYVPR